MQKMQVNSAGGSFELIEEAPGLELLLERPDIEMVAPHAPILMREVPEGVGDCRRLEQVFVLCIGEEFPEQRHVDAAIYIHVRDVDSLWMKIARHHLAETSHRKLGRSERRRVWPRPDARGRAGDQNGAAAPRKHFRYDLSRPQKRAQGMQSPSLLEHLRGCFK